MSENDEVHSIVRALQVIETLNDQSVTSVELLHRSTGIPKSTLIRLLTTLMRSGYVVQISRKDGYALTEKIMRLSAGFKYPDAVVGISRPLLDAFTRTHKWQVSLATRDFDAMRFRYNTRHVSPFSPDRRFLNRRVPILASAVGRAFLAYCSQEERAVVSAILKSSEPLKDDGHPAEPYDDDLENVRTKRYAAIERASDDPARRFRGFAIPIRSVETGTALASIAMFYYATAMTEAQAVSRFLDELYDVAAKIAAALAETPNELHDEKTASSAIRN